MARDIEADYAVKIPMGIEISRIAPLNSESSSSSLRRMDLGFMCHALTFMWLVICNLYNSVVRFILTY